MILPVVFAVGVTAIAYESGRVAGKVCGHTWTPGSAEAVVAADAAANLEGYGPFTRYAYRRGFLATATAG